MKYILFFIIFIIVLFLSVSLSAEEWEIQEELLIAIYNLEGGKEFLQKIIDQVNIDQIEINVLRNQRNILRQDIYVAKAQINSLLVDVKRSKGLFFGGVVGYPLFTGLAIIEYRFPGWSPMIIGGYSSRAFIGVGVNIKIGKRE